MVLNQWGEANVPLGGNGLEPIAWGNVAYLWGTMI